MQISIFFSRSTGRVETKLSNMAAMGHKSFQLGTVSKD
jgi:hypothetical protein